LLCRQRATAEGDTTRGVRSLRRASATHPPDVEPKEQQFDAGGEWHAETQQQRRPHVGSDESNQNAGNNGAQ